jgi:hypothetical protein
MKNLIEKQAGAVSLIASAIGKLIGIPARTASLTVLRRCAPAAMVRGSVQIRFMGTVARFGRAVEGNVSYIVERCQLPPESDAALHVISER